MTYRVRNIAVAIALALIAALLVTFYVSNYKRNVQQGEADVQVFVAAKDIPAGISGAAAAKQHLLEPRSVARRTVVPGAISDPEQIARLVATQRVDAGEQVTLRRFGSATQRGLRGQIAGTMRAVQVAGDANQLLLGTLRTGDHVDVVASVTGTGDTGNAARIVLRDIAVLRGPDSAPAEQRVAGSSTSNVLLAIRDTQVQRLFFVLKNAEWTLELRPATDAADSRHEVIETTNSVLGAGVRR
jgi:Flp pilus assembly protein CpaB